MANHQNPRDANNFRIPKEGTISRKIYDLLLLGHKPIEISKMLNVPDNTVRVLIHRFKHPDQMNAISLSEYKLNGKFRNRRD